jgi:hypothetical protein
MTGALIHDPVHTPLGRGKRVPYELAPVRLAAGAPEALRGRSLFEAAP